MSGLGQSPTSQGVEDWFLSSVEEYRSICLGATSTMTRRTQHRLHSVGSVTLQSMPTLRWCIWRPELMLEHWSSLWFRKWLAPKSKPRLELLSAFLLSMSPLPTVLRQISWTWWLTGHTFAELTKNGRSLFNKIRRNIFGTTLLGKLIQPTCHPEDSPYWSCLWTSCGRKDPSGRNRYQTRHTWSWNWHYAAEELKATTQSDDNRVQKNH